MEAALATAPARTGAPHRTNVLHRHAAPTASADSELAAPLRRCACGGGCPRCKAQAESGTTALPISSPDDAYEREAEQAADLIMSGASPGVLRAALPSVARLHRCTCGGHDAGTCTCGGAYSEGGMAPPIVHDVLAAGGTPLEADTRSFMEERFGADFSDVRVHADARAAESATAVDAYAYTVGPDLVFGAGQYAPGTDSGDRLIAHELAHVVQQPDTGLHRACGVTAIGKTPATCVLNSVPLPAIRFRFKPGCDEFETGEEARLRTFAKRAPGTLNVVGMASADGATDFNEALSCRRAEAGRSVLLSEGASVGTVVATGEIIGTEHDASARSVGIEQATKPSTAGPLIIEHTSGQDFEAPGLRSDASQFAATGSTLSLNKPAATRDPTKPITGGFTQPISLEAGFGTGTQTSNAVEVAKVIAAAGTRVPAILAPDLMVVAQDQFYFNALRSFLEKDNGSFLAMATGGFYDAKKPPTIQIGTSGGSAKTQGTLFHEMLHYVTDKTDSVVGEAKTSGGADHPLIEAIETRHKIVSLIRAGQVPLASDFESKFGRFQRGGQDFFVQMQDAIKANDGVRLKSIVDASRFVLTTVKSGLLPEASAQASRKQAGEFVTPPEGFRDLAFLWAQNAVYVRRAMRQAVDTSAAKNLKLVDVFADPDWRAAMVKFIDAFVTALNKNPQQDVVLLEMSL